MINIRRTAYRYRAPLLGVGVFLCFFGYIVFANYFDSFTDEQTIHVLPLSISEEGWKNTETLYVQDLSEHALFQAFTISNSAYLNQNYVPEGTSTISDPTEPSSDDGLESGDNEISTTTDDENKGEPSTPEIPVNNVEGEVDRESEQENVDTPTEENEERETPLLPEATPIDESPDVVSEIISLAKESFAYVIETIETTITDSTEPTAETEDVATVDELPALVSEPVIETLPPPDVVGDGEVELSTTTDNGGAEATSTPVLPIQTAFVPEIVWNGFSLPALAQSQTIENAQIRMSVGAKISKSGKEKNVAPLLRVQYSFEDEGWADAGTVIVTDEVSNALNGGYLLFALPPIIDPGLLRSLKIRAVYEGDLSDIDALFIDSLWVELSAMTLDRASLEARVSPDALTDLEKPKLHELISPDIDFTSDEVPHFALKYNEQRNIAVQLFRSVFSSNTATVEDITIAHRDVGELPIEPDVNQTEDGLWSVTIPPEDLDELRPGEYSLDITVNEGGVLFTDTVEFQWGLLAVNTNKTRYEVGESVNVSLGALSPNGNTLCEATLELYVIDQNNFIRRLPVDRSGQCNGNNIVTLPDYSSLYSTMATGTYELYVENIDPVDGRALAHTKTTFEVATALPFSIERTGPTRIYPVAPYEMMITVSASTSIDGALTERIPGDYEVLDTVGQVSTAGSEKTITFPVVLNAGESTTLRYTFDSPDISPYLYELGPASLAYESLLVTNPISLDTGSTTVVSSEPERVEVESNDDGGEFTEHKRWQIASDATGSMLIFAATSTTPTGWTCVSCAATSTFYQRLVVGSSTYGGTGGASTHTHTASGAVNTSATANAENNAGAFVSQVTHSHIYTPTIGSTSNLPAYRDLKVLQSNSAGEPATIPAGAVLMFDTTLPAGWSSVSSLVGRYVRGENGITATGSANTHTHAISGSTDAASGATVNSRTGGAQVTSAALTHTHTVSTSTGAVSQEPPYIEVIFASTTVATATPTGALTMWTDTQPAGWLSQSADATDPFNNKFPKGSASYGNTSGGETHTHSDMSGITSSAVVGTDNARSGATGSSNTHTHQIDMTGFTTSNHMPPYVGAIIARKYGLIPIYTEKAYRWYVNEDAITPTDPWPVGAEDVVENEPIGSDSVTVKYNDQIRLRVGIQVENSTSTADTFKLQYASTTAAGLCSALGNWADVGSATSSTVWKGYDNGSVADGATLSSSTLTGIERFESYEESNPTVATPAVIGIGEDGEWDYSLLQNGAEAGVDYCFRVVKSDGATLFGYDEYPRLTTNDATETFTLSKLFDNEKTGTTTPAFEFSGVDAESDSLTYQIQVDDTYAFSSTVIDNDSETNSTLFTNLTTPADKDPFNNGETIRFKSTTALTDGGTYYWRIRARDSGSNQYGGWSSINSFTIDLLATTTSTWFQTMREQFLTDTLVGVTATSTGQVQLISGSTTGTTTSSAIEFEWATLGNAWGSLAWNDNETAGDIKYHIEYEVSDGVWAYIPDTILSGNAVGYDNSPQSLLVLDPADYPTIRIVGVFTNSGGTPILSDWTLSWGFKINTPTITKLFPNEKTPTTTPTFEFTTTDPQGDDLTYEVQWSTTYAFTSSTTRVSDLNFGFSNITNGGDTQPFTSGHTIQYKVQTADTLATGTTYWWRVRAKDPGGSNTYSDYTDARSFTTDTAVVVSTWFQTTAEQFRTNTLSGATTTAQSATVATTAVESLVAYAEGTVQTPQYRTWNGSSWSAEDNALSVGATINWIVTKSGTTRDEYISATVGTDQDINVQVYKNGAWGNLKELTTAHSNAAMRGVDIAYETTSGDALVVSCDGDADPSYWVWNGTAWSTTTATVNVASASACGWIKLISDPTSDEIIVIVRDVVTGAYEAQVWDGSAWGNSTTLGSMVETDHEGIAASYEESGGQAVVVASNAGNSNFIWRAWNGTTWTATATVILGDDFEAGTLTADVGTDNMGLCYVDNDGDIGVVRWTGAAWAGQIELEIAGTRALFFMNDRPVDCQYEVGGSRDGYLTVAYSDTTNIRFQTWDGAVWSVEASVSTIQDAQRVQLRRTGDRMLQLLAFDFTNDRYDFSTLVSGTTTWSTFQTLETNASVGATPYKEPFMMATRNPGITGNVVVAPSIDFNDGSGPYWQQLSWNDAESGGSSILYQVEYYTESTDTWALVPDSLIPGNSLGTSTSPVSLVNVLPVATTYNVLRPVANMSCNAGVCPLLNDWTLTWAAGINISGTAQQYNQSGNLTSGTVAVALNGVLQVGKTGTISAGTWSITNVNAAPGDVISVFIDGVADSGEAGAVTVYDGVGDVSGMNLYERHLSIGSNDNGTTTNANIGLYDQTNDEDLFFDVALGALTVCAAGETSCQDGEIIVKALNIFQPGSSAAVTTHDFENNGTFVPNGNTIRLNGSWDNNATATMATSTVIFTATSTIEYIDQTGSQSNAWNNLTLGETSGTATWNASSTIDVDGTLSVNFGTLARNTQLITVGGSLANGASGQWSGLGTTTFDGAAAANWSDANATKQDVGHVVVDGTTKTVTLTSNVRANTITIGANDILDANTPTSYDITVLNHWTNNNVFNARAGEVIFIATTSARVINTGSSGNFYDLTFNGVAGAWSFAQTTLTVGNDLTISTGTVTLSTGTTTVAGSLLNTGGTFAHNNGELMFTSTGAETITFGATQFTNGPYNLSFNGSGGSWNITDTSATSSNNMRIFAGTPTFPSTQLSVGGSFFTTGGAFTHNNGTIRMYGSSAKTVTANGSSFFALRFDSTSTSTLSDTNVTALANLVVNAGTTTLPTGTFTLGGSLTNSGSLTHGSGTVLFNSSDVGETISLGASPLYNMTFNNAGGGWTISANATATNAFTLTALNSFTLTSGRTLAVLGTFANSVGGAGTTWATTTLMLNGSTTYAINASTTPGDTYGTLAVGSSTKLSMWNSSSATTTVGTSGYLYSQDNAGIDGDLSIYGAYTRSSGTEYWNALRDFDGTVLGTGRRANVRFSAGSSAVLSSSTLSVVGTSTASTTIAALSGTYTIGVAGGTTTMQYYDFTNLGTTGITLGTSTIVTSLADGRIVPGIAAGTGFTVSSTTIDANPALQIYRVEFSTTTAIAATNVTQSGGTPASYWWFRNSTGNIDGEAYDLDTGDPGSIRWDDSAYVISVSGTVYSDAGTTPMGTSTCDGVTNNVRIVVNSGSSTYNGTCAVGTGIFTIPGVTYIGDPVLTVFLNTNGGARGATITKTPTANISGLRIYQNRVITRHENVTPLSIADMALYDEDNDSDLRYTATTSASTTLTVRGETELFVYASTTFTPNGNVTLQSGGSGQSYDATFHVDNSATATAQGTEIYTVGGRFQVDSNSVFVSASSTVIMTATSSGKTISSPGTINFNNLSFTGSGSWDIVSNLSVAGNISLNSGTVTGSPNIDVNYGSFGGAGTLLLTGGTTTIARSNTLGSSTPWSFYNLILGNGSIAGATTRGDIATTTVLNRLTINTAHTLSAGGSRWDIRGSSTPFVISGTFTSGTSTVRYAGGGATNITSATYYNLDLNASSSAATYTATGIGIAVLGDMTVGGVATTTVNFDTSDPTLAVTGNLTIRPRGVLIGSGSGTFTVLGNWDNDGVFAGQGGTVTFSGATSTTISAGVSSFSNLVVNGDAAFLFNESATSTGTFTISQAGTFTVSNGLRMAVGGQFANNVNGGVTNWNTSTLYLYSGTSYLINPKSTADQYGTLEVGPNTDIRMWNSGATTTIVDTTSSLYSQDHANNNGRLYIYGDYVNTSGTDYWSYAIDFDGTVLGGSSRKVDVGFASGAAANYQGGGLWIFGDTAASTTIANQGSGTYTLTVGGTASTTLRYYEMRNMTSSGLVFTGTPNVVSISNGDFLVSTGGGSGITVGGTVINQNPAKTFSSNRFATSTAIAAINVTATGTSVSSWRFTNEVGNISGEAYDSDPAGDPGYVVWTNSASNITVGGRVYSDEGVTVSSVCNGSSNVVRLVVAGVTSYTTSCAAGTGLYSIPGVTFSANDTLTLYIDGTTTKATTVSVSPVSSISDMDLYENRVIVRHENTTPLSIAAMAVYDSVSDPDVQFTAVDAGTDTLTLPANRKLLVWQSKEFSPNGNVTISGGGGGAAYDGTLELFTNAIFTAQGTESHSIGGSLILGSGATFTAAQSTLTLTTTGSARTVDVNQNSFYNLTFNGSGSWVVSDANLTANNNVTITTGGVTLPTGTTTVAGSFQNNGGTFVHSTGTLAFTATSGGKTVRAGGSNMYKVIFNGAGGAWSMTDTNATATASMIVTIGTVTLPSGVLTVGTDFNTASGTITHNSGTLRLIGTTTNILRTNGSDLSNLTFGGAGSYTMVDGSVALTGGLTISNGSVTLATNTLSIAGSLLATGGTFSHASGSVLFNSSDAGETINTGISRFYNVSFASASGGWTISANATATNNFSLTSAASFRQASSTTLHVGGVFTNGVGGSATNWDGSTLLIATTTGYAINTKTTGGDRYNILSVGSSTHLSMWNSNATTTNVATSGSLYSQDHAAVDGELYIYGNYGKTAGADYWNYAIDFDGAVLVGGARRAVTVRHASNATTSISGTATLNIVGDSTASTTVTNQGSGNFSLQASGGTFNAQYYLFRNQGAGGLSLTGTTTVTTLSNGDFELAVSGGNLISVSSTTVNANASAVYSSIKFATTTAITGVNVALAGSTSAAWTFSSESGNLSGEAYDSDGVDACGSIRWSNSSCLLLQEAHYRWRNDDGGEGAPNSEWYNLSWTKRKRVPITNSDATTYTNLAVEIPVTYDSDMQTNFADLRFTASDGVTQLDFWRETYTASTNAVVWVEIPSLLASSDTTIFMYYGNGLASDASVGTTTFAAFDDFEDGGITEYSGDTGMFTVGTAFEYERTYGLDAVGNQNSQTTDGIYRTALTMSQGQTIRYFEYVDTSAPGSSDEPCTLFGVQSPGANNNNYAVCLPLVGTDRVVIAKNVFSNQNSGTILSSTTITSATGWHEVEIDWRTNNSIFVSVYRNNTLVATTSASDSSYTTGGIGFSYWFMHGGWDIISARPYTTTDPSVRFGAEQVSGGASWLAALDTFASSFTASTSARLRFGIENTGLAVTNKQFRLEYAEKGVSPSCESVASVNYTAVPVAASCGSSPICMYNSGNITDLASSTDQLGGAGQFTFGQVVKNASNKTGALNMSQSTFTETEYSIVPTQNATAGTYCLRVTDNGTTLDGYTRVAEMRLRYNPVVTNVVLNGGNDITLSPGSTTTVSATATITDQNGWGDITQATGTMFRSGVGAQCSENDNSCYKAASSSCSFLNCSGFSCQVSCSADFYYFADPTDIGFYGLQDWGAYISAVDTAGGYGTSSSAINKELITLRALEVTQTINFGSLQVATDTGAYNATTTIENIGNDSIDVSIAGTNLTSGASSIPVGNEKFATTSFTYSLCPAQICNPLATSTTALEVDLTKPVSTSTVADVVFWGIAVPFGAAASAHEGQNTFYAIAD